MWTLRVIERDHWVRRSDGGQSLTLSFPVPTWRPAQVDECASWHEMHFKNSPEERRIRALMRSGHRGEQLLRGRKLFGTILPDIIAGALVPQNGGRGVATGSVREVGMRTGEVCARGYVPGRSIDTWKRVRGFLEGDGVESGLGASPRAVSEAAVF